MKKFLVLLLILGVAAGAFAQFTATVTADFNADVFVVQSPTGDDDDRPGRVNFLTNQGTGSAGSFMKGNELRVVLNWRGENWHAMARLNADGLLRGTGGLVNGEGNGANINSFLNSNFDEWHVTATPGPFALAARNTADRGKTAGYRFQNFSDFLKTKIDNFGVIVPGSPLITGTPTGSTTAITYWGQYAGQMQDWDNNNLLRSGNLLVGGTANTNEFNGEPDAHTRTGTPYWSIGWDMNDLIGMPFTLQIAGDIGNNSGISGSGYSRFNGAVRFSGEKIADMVTFDALYSFRGGDRNESTTTNFPAVTGTSPNFVFSEPTTTITRRGGEGIASHTFGLYAGLSIMDGLGISFGYTGLFRTYEDVFDSSENKTYEVSGPFFSGIDLRLQFTGVENLTVTFNNNISFASVEGKDNEVKVGLLGGIPLYDHPVGGEIGAWLGKGESSGWFALYNALGFNYRLTDPITVSFQLGNRLRRLSYEYSDSGIKAEATVTANHFAMGASVSYAFSSNILLESGLIFGIDTVTTKYEFTGSPSTEEKSGTLSFGVPIRFRVTW